MDETPYKTRKRPAHYAIHEKGNRAQIIYITACTKYRRPLLANKLSHQAIIDGFEEADHFVVGRYVVMPDHIHFFCAPNVYPTESLRKWMAFWKSQATRRMKNILVRPVWQKDFWDRQLRSGDSYAEKWEYVRNNPVRAGLVEKADDWPYQGELNTLRWHD